jgi:hypothetical protein
MEADKDPYLPVIREIVEYLRPDITNDTDSSKGKQMGTSIVEGTGHFDAATMATWFVGNLVGPSLDWIRYRMAERRFRGDDTMNAFAQRIAEFMLEEVYAYPASNFYEVNNHFVLDGLTMGSPVMLVEEDRQNNQKVCTLPHWSQNYLMRDWFGNDVAYHRKWKINNFSAMQGFGKDKLPESIKRECEQGSYTTEHEYLMCIARAGDPIFQGLKPQYEIPLLRPWMQMWFCISGITETEKKPLNYIGQVQPDGSTVNIPTSSPGYWHKPFHSWHYNRLPHETYSRTPGWSALPDVKGLNAAWRTIHETAHKYARPSSYALDSLKGKLQLGAGGVTWLTNEEYLKPPKQVEDRSNYNWAMDFLDRRTKTVGRHFFADMARMIETYSRDHTQPPTAYQLSQMISETMVLVGPAITSYAGPALQNIDDQFVELEARPLYGNDVTTSRFWSETQPPDEIWESNGMIAPVFTGPLVQGLKYAMMAKRIQQPLMTCAPMFQIWPDTKNKVRAETIVERILESGDFPQDSIRGADEYAEIMQVLAAERRQAQIIERASAMADMVPKLQGSTEEKSPMQLMEAA